MRRRFNVHMTLLMAVLAAVTLSASPASAAPTVTVKNLGQSGLVSLVPQAPAVITSRGTCGDTRTVEEANGEESTCPAGTWPVQGDVAWATPTVDAIAGDTLELTFSEAPDFVTATLTTAFPIGLRTPPCPASPSGGVPCVNGDVPIPNTGSTLIAGTTAKSAVFTIKLPSPVPGVQVAVTGAGPADSASNYAFGLSGPRWENELTKCGVAFYAPGDTRALCPANDVKGPPPRLPSDPVTGTTPGAGGASPVALSISLTRAPVLRKNKLGVATTTSAAGRLTVALRRGGKTLVRRTQDVAAGSTDRTFTLRRSQWEKLARYPRRSYVVVAKFEAGGKTATTSSRVTWRAR